MKDQDVRPAPDSRDVEADEGRREIWDTANKDFDTLLAAVRTLMDEREQGKAWCQDSRGMDADCLI